MWLLVVSKDSNLAFSLASWGQHALDFQSRALQLWAQDRQCLKASVFFHWRSPGLGHDSFLGHLLGIDIPCV